MKLPKLLTIGVADSGTIPLFSDLGSASDIFFSAVKEPENLIHESVLSEEGVRKFASGWIWGWIWGQPKIS